MGAIALEVGGWALAAFWSAVDVGVVGARHLETVGGLKSIVDGVAVGGATTPAVASVDGAVLMTTAGVLGG